MTNNNPRFSLGSDALEQDYCPQSCPLPPTKLRRVAGAARTTRFSRTWAPRTASTWWFSF